MGYEAALLKSWDALLALKPAASLNVRFLADEYSLHPEERKILSLSRKAPAKEFAAVLILHYLAQAIKGLPALTGEWLTFRELSGVEGYEAAFRKRSLEPLIKKYGSDPQGLHSALERLPGRIINEADACLEIKAFDGVPVLIKLWKEDEEFGPDANIFFDKSITGIFCTEDIVVLAGFVAAAL
jgi:hypothetical protein